MEVCSRGAETTQTLIPPLHQPPSLETHGMRIASFKDHHTIPGSKANSLHHKKHGKKGILDRIVLMKLNEKKDKALSRAPKESVEEKDGVKDEKLDTLERSVATKQCGDKKYVGKTTVGKNKRKRGKSIQGLIWKGDSLEQDYKKERTNDTQKEERLATCEEVTRINNKGLVQEQYSIEEQQEMNADVDKEIVGESLEVPQESGLIGGRFQALNAKPSVFKTSGKLFGMMSKMEDRKRHTCGECGRSFNQLRVLTIHQQMHTVKRTPSLINDEQSAREQTLQVSEHSERGEPCLPVDAGSVHEKKELCAKEEKEVTHSRNYLQEVSEQHVKGANHVKATTKKRRKLDPDKSCSDQKGYSCDACGKVFSLPSFLRRHQIVHTGEKAFACKICGKRFGQKATQQRHEQTHGRKRPYMCSECGDGFSSNNRLKRHVKENHKASSNKSDLPAIKISLKLKKAPSNKAYGSNKYEVSTATDFGDEEVGVGKEEKSAGVNSEVLIKTSALAQPKEPKVYTCLICEKTFLQRSHLLRHSLCHTGEKPFRCKECGKGFTQKSTCQRHERTHSGELLFICTECGNSFAQKSGLQKHRLIHTGEKPYGCRFCDCRFTQKTTCQRHERIHTGEKPYVCQQCGKAFGQSTSLERHVKTHAKVKSPNEDKGHKRKLSK